MKRVKGVLAKVLNISEDVITVDTSSENVDTWDSLNALLLVTELENCFNIKLTMDEVESLSSVKNISVTLARHGIELEEE